MRYPDMKGSMGGPYQRRYTHWIRMRKGECHMKVREKGTCNMIRETALGMKSRVLISIPEPSMASWKMASPKLHL